MSPGLRTTTLGGILLLSITAFQSEHAIAFGQQWRPMSGLEPGPGGAHQRLGPAPAFRPWPATRPARYRHMPQQPLAPQPPGWQGWRTSAGPAPQMRHAANGYVRSANRPLPRFNPTMIAATAPARTYPSKGFARASHSPPPLFSRQYAWRPASRPWVARAPAALHMMRPAVGLGASYAAQRLAVSRVPVPGSWRPDIGPRHVYPPGAYTDFRRAHGWPRGLPPGQVAGFAGMPPMAAMQRGMPRPGHGFRGAGPRAAAAFRPATYGRSNSVARVDSGGRDLRRAQPVLPGWATTYRETDHAGSCLWCRGG